MKVRKEEDCFAGWNETDERAKIKKLCVSQPFELWAWWTTRALPYQLLVTTTYVRALLLLAFLILHHSYDPVLSLCTLVTALSTPNSKHKNTYYPRNNTIDNIWIYYDVNLEPETLALYALKCIYTEKRVCNSYTKCWVK